MSTSWSDRWIAFDTETTGLGPTARVIEIGVVVFEKGEPVHEWAQLLWPGTIDWEDPHVKGALEVNRLTKEDLLGKPTFEQVLPQMLRELSSEVWVAHNADFDLRMLDQEMARLELRLARPRIVVCTKNLSCHLNKTTRGNKLSEAAARWAIVQENAHRAAEDARVCGLILSAMLRAEKLPSDEAQMLALLQEAENAWKSRPQYGTARTALLLQGPSSK